MCRDTGIDIAFWHTVAPRMCLRPRVYYLCGDCAVPVPIMSGVVMSSRAAILLSFRLLLRPPLVVVVVLLQETHQIDRLRTMR